MSKFCTMTTRERKIQAAAICREVQAQEDVEMDLGKKVSVPKDVMLEELSLASNRGSRLFKMRQRRSEKYTFESARNDKQLNGCRGEPEPIPADIGQEDSIVSPTENGNATESHRSDIDPSHNEVPSDAPKTGVEPNPDIIAPGYGGPLKEIPPERFNSTAVPKSYHSPWEQAIISDPALADTLIAGTPAPEPRADLPVYKSFNRVAMPFGGLAKTPGPAPVKTPQMEPLPDCQDAPDRPSFNRAAQGWVSAGDPAPCPAVSPEPVLVPESEDL